MSIDRKTSNISIIIPTLNEAETIGTLLSQLRGLAGVELLVVDGGSADSTIDVVKSLGMQILSSSPGKAIQMNTGAEAARSDILLFLHSDTKLPADFAGQIRDTLNQPGISAGAFKLAIDGKSFGLRIIEWLANFRSKILQMPYGDQGIFVTKDMFFSVGVFPPQPIMEDFELMRRLKKRGKIAILPLCATTSARRWERLGTVVTTAINQAIIIGYLLGVNPEKLAHGHRFKVKSEK